MDQKKKGLDINASCFIIAIGVLFALMVLTYILTFVVPGGEYARTTDASGNTVVDIVQGFSYVDGGIAFWKWLLSPFLVLTASGNGTIIAVLIFLIVIGGIFNCLDKCGMMAHMLHKIIVRFGAKRYTLLAVVTAFFLMMGAFIGSFEECVPLVPIVAGLAVGLGWDKETGLGMSLIAVGCGFASGVLNPFTVGVAQKLAGVPMFSGMGFRLLSAVCIYALLLWFLRGHAKRIERPVKVVEELENAADAKDLSGASAADAKSLSGANVAEARSLSGANAGEVKSLSGANAGEVRSLSGANAGEVKSLSGANAGEVKNLSGANAADMRSLSDASDAGSKLADAVTDTKPLDRAVCAFAIVVGAGIGLILSSSVITALQDYTMIIVALMFLVAGILASRLSGMSRKRFAIVFKDGVVSVLPAILLILMASSIRYTLEEARIMDTILHAAATVCESLPKPGIVLVMYLVALIVNFFVSSGSAEAILLMPIMAPLAQMTGISSQLCVLAYAYGDGFSNVFYPTNAVLLISLGLVGLGYGDYVKWSWKFHLLNLVLTSLLLLLGFAVGY